MSVEVMAIQVLNQMSSALEQVKPEDFTKPIDLLHQATIGQHSRHILEFFSCLIDGSRQSHLNYDLRQRDQHMQNDKAATLAKIDHIKQQINAANLSEKLLLEVNYSPNRDEMQNIETNFLRELVYNIEHAIHHMALLRIGLNRIAPYVKLPEEFGLARSTLYYRKNIANA
ncbi:MAG: hypothetical protein ACNS62_14725 [Candidatus Cyclobacteriaceae bacterium M3_2C_046]